MAGQKSPAVAALLSFLIPGIGQLYCGETKKGVIFFVLGIVFALSMVVLVGYVLYPIFWLYNIYDAYKTAKKA